MNAFRGISFKFILLVVVPAFMTVAVMAAAVFGVIDSMSENANDIARQRSQKAARAAVSEMLEQNRRVAEDNALWDDAVERTLTGVDEDWVRRTWGETTGGGIYDSFAIADDQGRILSGYQRGEKLDAPAAGVFGAGLEQLVREAKPGAAEITATGYLKSERGVAAFAVTPILSNGGTVEPPGRPLKYLIIGSTLTPEKLAAMARSHAIDGLALSDAPADANNAIAITDAQGRIAANLVWSDTGPGDIVRDNAVSKIRSSFVLVFFVVSMLLAAIWNNSRRRAESEAAAVHQSLHDELSGLPNRRQFGTRMRQLGRRPFALLFIDIDRFKEVNDSYGHEMGDRLIRAVAAGFAALAPEGTTLARLGGDEFAILLEGEDAMARAPDLANTVIAFMCMPFDFDSRVISVGASIGIVGSEYADCTPDEFLRRADTAMYRAKKNGRNQYFVYTPALEEEREARRTMASALRAGIRNNEISVHYQPYVASASREIIGVEALLRWTSPALGYVSPAAFVSVAEEFGLIDELGMYVLFAACAQAAQWPGLKVSVNVSPAQFSNVTFIDTVKAAIARAGISGEQIELEVTEGYLIDEPEQARALIYRLHDLGVSVSIDDFGTGYSSIGYLRKFNFDKLKIDRSLVVGIMTNPEAQKIIQATVLIADALHLKVTAEGVEHEEEAMVLRAAGVDQFQGYLFHRPMPAEAVTALLTAPSADRQFPSFAGAA